MPAYLGGDGLVYVNGRHLCSIRGGDLCRTFDPQRELMRGCLAFRLDIVNLAIKTGAMRIVAKERGTGNRWAIDMVTFIGKGDLYRHHLYGEQWRCSLKHWSLNGQTPEAQLEPVQPTLFEVAA